MVRHHPGAALLVRHKLRCMWLQVQQWSADMVGRWCRAKREMMPLMVDPLEAAARLHREAITEESEVKRLLAEVKARRAEVGKKVEATRAPLAAAIVEAARARRPQVEIVAISGYNREHIRRICRAAGIEPAP